MMFFFGKPIDGKGTLSDMNGYGDVKNNLLELRKRSQKEKLDTLIPRKNLVLPLKNADPVTDFIRWCQKNRITVIAGYPAFLDFPEYHTGAEQLFFHALGDFYHSLGVPTLGEPSDFMFPKSLFFNTEYHMHNEGAAVMTKLVAQRLEPILGVTKKLDGYKPDKQIDHPVLLLFGVGDIPDEIESLDGFSNVASWGRWTVAGKASIGFLKPLPAHFRLDAYVAHVFKDNAKTPIRVRVGKEERSILVSAPRSNISLEFQTDGKTHAIEIIPPKPQSPKQLGLSDDQRMLGLGLSRLEITPLDAGKAAKWVAKPR